MDTNTRNGLKAALAATLAIGITGWLDPDLPWWLYGLGWLFATGVVDGSLTKAAANKAIVAREDRELAERSVSGAALVDRSALGADIPTRMRHTGGVKRPGEVHPSIVEYLAKKEAQARE